MAGHNFFGIVANGALLLVLLIAAVTPWFSIDIDVLTNNTAAAGGEGDMTTTTMTPAVDGISSCDVHLMFGLTQVACKSTGCNAGEIVKSSICSQQKASWRTENKLCGNLTAGGDCKKTGEAFDISIGLLLGALTSSLLLAIGFFVRCCCCKKKNDNFFMLLIALVGFSANIAAVVYYAIKFPSTLKLDGVCNMLELLVGLKQTGKTPCNSIFGNVMGSWNTALNPPALPHVNWNPAIGWFFAAIALPIWLMVLVSAVPTKKAGDYQNLQDAA